MSETFVVVSAANQVDDDDKDPEHSLIPADKYSHFEYAVTRC